MVFDDPRLHRPPSMANLKSGKHVKAHRLIISAPLPIAPIQPGRQQSTFAQPKRLSQHHKERSKPADIVQPCPTQSNVTAPPIARGSWKALFNFATGKHLPVLLASIFCSVLVGLVTPIQAYLMGKVFSTFAKFGVGQMTENDFKHDLGLYCIYFVVLGAVCWLFTIGLFAGWVIFGELQARSARDRLFNALVDRDIEWFDQRKDGVAALATRLQGFGCFYLFSST
jgi:ATP-binding cassette subfamily B (MDR/TAP) protein 1